MFPATLIFSDTPIFFYYMIIWDPPLMNIYGEVTALQRSCITLCGIFCNVLVIKTFFARLGNHPDKQKWNMMQNLGGKIWLWPWICCVGSDCQKSDPLSNYQYSTWRGVKITTVIAFECMDACDNRYLTNAMWLRQYEKCNLTNGLWQMQCN